MTIPNAKTYRIESIDVLRGIVMMIMALDHVRHFFHITGNVSDPLDLATTTPWLFATRWITHLCAPTFVFLSGVSIYLQSLRKTKKELSSFLITRGLWLIFVEGVIVTFAVNFDPFFHQFQMVVVWAIGVSMVALWLLIYLPYKAILAIGAIIVLGHNLLDIPEAAADFKPDFWWDVLHTGHLVAYPIIPGHYFVILYPILPWTGLMILGYCAGVFFTSTYTPEQRSKITLRLGIGLIIFFFIVRYINVYGDPIPWTKHETFLNTFLSFITVEKYPPSLMYMSIMIGIAMLALSALEFVRNRFTSIAIVFGRTALFYYVIHFLLIHILATIAFFMRGTNTVQEALDSTANIPFLFVIPGVGYGLPVVYAIWITVVLIMYPLCKWHDQTKRRNKGAWWVSYV